jgi:hypothetical protein
VSIDVEVSADVTEPRPVVWEALFGHDGTGSAPVSVRMGDAVVRVDLVDAPEGFTGSAVWDSIVHRVTVHLIDKGPAATLVLVTAEAQADEASAFGLRAARTQRHAHRDARRDIEHWLEAVPWPSAPGDR